MHGWVSGCVRFVSGQPRMPVIFQRANSSINCPLNLLKGKNVRSSKLPPTGISRLNPLPHGYGHEAIHLLYSPHKFFYFKLKTLLLRRSYSDSSSSPIPMAFVSRILLCTVHCSLSNHWNRIWPHLPIDLFWLSTCKDGTSNLTFF